MTVPKPSPEDMRDRAEIDRSARYPVLFFFTSAAAWLFVATLFGFVSALKLCVPGLWDGFALLTYGRLFPVHLNALVYGWGMQAGIGVMIWLMARLTKSRVKNPTTIIVIGHVWNAAISLGVISIWFGFGTSIPFLDFPGWVGALMLLSYLLLAVWLVPMFRDRASSSVYVSEMYVIGAAVWFPWIFLTATFLIGKGTAPVMGAGIDAWYISNLIYFWMAPVALAVAYYIIPKIAGRPIYSYPLARVSFWLLAILAGWTGFSRYMGGPFPAWMPSISSAASIFILIAILATATNLFLTLRGKSKLWEISPSLRFTVFGVLLLAIYAVLAALSSTFTFGKNLQFSHFLVGLDTLAVYGFFSMVVFGAIYFIVPRITGQEWPSGSRIRTHFWFNTYGIGTLVISMLVGGIAQGGNIAEWDQAFSTSFVTSAAMMVGRVLAWALIAFANLLFFWQLALMFVGKGRKSEGATLIHAKPGTSLAATEAGGAH